MIRISCVGLKECVRTVHSLKCTVCLCFEASRSRPACHVIQSLSILLPCPCKSDVFLVARQYGGGRCEGCTSVVSWEGSEVEQYRCALGVLGRSWNSKRCEMVDRGPAMAERVAVSRCSND